MIPPFAKQPPTYRLSRYLVLRFCFFSLLAYDLVTVTFKHAARYGIEDFNVPQFSWMSSLTPVPSAEWVGALWIMCALSSLLAAFGVLASLTIRLTCVLYAGIYFSSQIDSYQHHYLLALLLFLFALPKEAFWRVSRAPDERRSWVPNLFYLQIAIVYFWTAVAKVDSTWVSGATLQSLSNSEVVLSYVGTWTTWLYGTAHEPLFALNAMYQTLAGLVIIGEFFLPLCFLFQRLRLIGLIISPFFHVGVEMLGLDIELFSFYMISINFILLSPDRLWGRLDAWLEQHYQSSANAHQRARILIAFAALVGTLCLYQIDFPRAHLPCTLLLVLAVGILMRPSRDWKSLLHIGLGLAFAPILLMWTFNQSDAIYDYYRMKGGDLSRRLPLSGQPDYAAKVEAVISTYETANAQRQNEPARRSKTAKYLLRVNRADQAAATLKDGYRVHNRAISELKQRLREKATPAVLEQLTKTQLGLAKICRSIQTLPQPIPSLTSSELTQCRSAMKLNSKETLAQLRALNTKIARKRFDSRLKGWSDEGNYRSSDDTLLIKIRLDTQPNDCDAALSQASQWRYQYLALSFGVPLTQRLPRPSVKRLPSEGCAAELRAPLSPFFRYLSTRGDYTRVSRARQRAFGSTQ